MGELGMFVWIAVGAGVGAIAHYAMHDDGPGLLGRICLGIAGGVTGAWIAVRVFGPHNVMQVSWQGIVGGVVGAIVLIGVDRATTVIGRRQHEARVVTVHEPESEHRRAA